MKKLIVLGAAVVVLLALALALVLGSALWLARPSLPRRAAPPTLPSYFEDARPVAAAFAPVLGPAAEICSVNIHERHAILTVRRGAEATLGHRLRQADGLVTPAGTGFCVAGPARPLSEAVFPWTAVDLAIVPAMVLESRRRLGLGAHERLSHLLLERPLGDPAAAHFGAGAPAPIPPRWRAMFTTSAAHAEFDLKGSFVAGVDAAGKAIGPAGPVHYLTDASAIPRIIAERLGAGFQLARLEILPGYFFFEGRLAGQPSGLARYNFRAGTLHGPEEAAMGFRPDLEQSLFSLEELDFALVPKMIAEGRRRLADPGATGSGIVAEKNMFHPGLYWIVHLAGHDSQPLVFDGAGRWVRGGAAAPAGSE